MYDTIVIMYRYYEQIDPYDTTGNVCGYTNEEKLTVIGAFSSEQTATQIAPRCPSFK